MSHTTQTPNTDADADTTVNANPDTTTQTEETATMTATMTDTDTTTPDTATDTAADLDRSEAAALKLESDLLTPGLAVSTPDPALKLEPAGQGDDDADEHEPATDPITAAREVLRAQLQAREDARKREEAEREEARQREEEARAAALAAERAAERAAAIAAMRPMYLADVIRALSQSLECEIVLSADATLATLPVTALLALADNDLDERIERDLFGDSDADDDADEETEDKPTTARKAGKRKAAKRNASTSKPAEKSDRATIEAALIEIVESAGPDGYKVAEVMPHLAKRRLDYTKGRVGVLLRELVAAGKIDTVGNPPAGIRYVKAKASKRTKLQVAAGS